MIHIRRVLAFAAALLIATHITASSSAAQQDTALARVDTVQAGTDTTQAMLEEGPPAPTILPIAREEVPPGPLSPGSRYVFTRDSLLWSGAYTLADLLAEIPGVYVARAGFTGVPHYIQYGGRGGSALEIYWDGIPWVPLGGDTLFVDPGRFPLTYIRRVDVEVLPQRLRVFMVSERHETMDIRTKIRVESGTHKSAQYTALFQKRARNGIGIDLAAHFFGTDGPNKAAGSDAFDMWAKLGWMPNDRIGASYQIRRQDLDRDVVSGPGGVGVPGVKGARTEYQLALFAATRGDDLGLRADAGLVTSTWTADSTSTLEDQRIQHAYASVKYARPSWTAEVRGRVADSRTRESVEARAGWVPFRGLVISGDARLQRHEHNRSSREVHGAAALYFGPVYLAGDVSLGDAVQAPAIPDDTAQQTFDRGVRAGLKTKWLTGYVGAVQRDAYQPYPYPELGAIPQLGPSAEATYLVTEFYLRPVSALTLSGWYSDPINGELAALQPPNHIRAALTLRTKFWRTFRSGAFDFKAQVGMESWSDGIAGLSGDGSPIPLPAALFWEYHLEVQLVGFTAFWSLRNAQLAKEQIVPGLDYPGNLQTFGVSWTFSN